MNRNRTAVGEPDLRSRVLIVEDDFEVAQVIALTLQEAGYETQTASHAAEALAMLEGDTVGVIVLDIFLRNGMNGMEFLAEARARGTTAAVVVVSGSEEGADLARQVGAGHLMKPFDLDELIAAVEAAEACG